METGVFVNIVGFMLGTFIIAYGTFVCKAPLKFILKIIANSVSGCLLLFLINKYLPFDFLSGGINPITAVCVGILGIPGVIAVIILS